MTVASRPTRMTADELLTLPEDGTDRWLIRGELRETGITYRNRSHSRIMVKLAYLLQDWLGRQPAPRGELLCGQAGVRLRQDPDTVVGVDVVYISAELAAQPSISTIISGIPVLAVEILSPSDKQDEIDEKIEEYLAAGVPLVWVVNPRRRTVVVFQPGSEPELFTPTQELCAEPHLPGFRIAVREIFD